MLNPKGMKKIINEKRISIGLLIIIIIMLLYSIISNNETAMVVAALILALISMLETIWTIKRKEYKTIYWIALFNLIIILSVLTQVGLYFTSTEGAGVDQLVNRLLLRDILRFAFLSSYIISFYLHSERFKINNMLVEKKEMMSK